MKTLIASALLSVVCSTAVMAQRTEQRDKPSPDEKIAAMIEELKLNQEQADKLKAVMADQQVIVSSQKAIIKASEKTIEAAKELLRVTKEKTDAQMQEILTEEQMIQFREMKRGRDEE